ncbi:hypothetical protein M409DRAFT_19748 [Zasmidium cellare ATCC 36951]|uniref:Uncharacterized protein n=1 Tax=Zasmidium cellare ATCC 36951 TaxID=1080233 RepID=A0A6A6CTV2_ZASCE|nr:uncharacterized protein M409DRAFT_19748 [Zasmidium cellare ATCC 36951]KAF2170143.1 hypothetical protein M409DRAFT_19748 [Zasmidium cellare ATCC 36951]
MSPLFIAIVVLGVVIAVVIVVLVWLTWSRRRRQGVGKGGEREVEEEAEKPVVREPELSWATGPTLINQGERDSHWSAGTLVALNESSQRGQVGQGVARGRSPAAPPIPPRAVNRRPVPEPGRDRELPSTPAPFTPLMTPVSPIKPQRRRPEVIDEDEILPVVDHESYRPSPVSPLESDSFTRSRSVR